MKTLNFVLPLMLMFLAVNVNAQTVDEILANYYENTGGLENWKALEGVKLTAKVNQGGIEFPIEIYQMKDGKQLTKITVQGNEIYQGVFDGETLWGTNFQSMKAEPSSDEETANMKLDANDFPSDFIDYKEKGYTVELVGNETIDGAETFKVKLVKEPIMVDGVQKDDVTFYYFDTENFVPIATHEEIHRGPGKGQEGESLMSDYQEVDGLYFPFGLSQGIKGGPSQGITIESIELNPTIDDKSFAFPDTVNTPK